MRIGLILLLFAGIFPLVFSPKIALCTTQVTTYVVKVQEERKSTRWTLTEWLRIKERMRLMDLWLAMFSDPKSKFEPEFLVMYLNMKGEFSNKNAAASNTTSYDTGSHTLKAQLWLTNLLSCHGVKTLNVDLGIEGYQRRIEKFDQEINPMMTAGGKTGYASLNFRIFGKNIQDSSLVLKYGNYRTTNPAFLISESSLKGDLIGAEISLYLFKWLGIEGNYLKFHKAKTNIESSGFNGHYYDYNIYIEISLIRILLGYYQESWAITKTDSPSYDTEENGRLIGLKLQF